nr:hypothetical protein BaRGS_034374 [Batillaria attramentaria]
MTGYVLFAINRRQQIKQSHPQLPFTEVTKILGQEWSCMPADKKQKYLDEAEIDKQRYIEELKEFQKSDMYQTLVKKKRLKGGETDDAFGACTDVEVSDDADELHCRVCNLYFSSLHNKKEHMFGRQHLQAITDQLEKELKKQQKQQELAQQESQLSASGDVSPPHGGPLSDLGESVESCKPSRPVDISSFIVEFVQKNYERDQEIAALRRILRRDVQENWTICKQIQELKEYESKLRQDMKTLTAQTNTLSTEINTLKTVPALFGVVEF